MPEAFHPISLAEPVQLAKVKGTNLIGAVKVLRRNRAHAQAALPAPLHHYLEQRVLPTMWYPEEDLLALLRAIAPLFKDLASDPYEVMGRTTVREHMGGVYEHLLQGDRMSLARRVTVIWQTLHDTGHLAIAGNAPGRARYELSDFGHPSREMCKVIGGYIAEALVASGFEKVQIDKVRCVLDGHDRCAWECKWRDGAAS